MLFTGSEYNGYPVIAGYFGAYSLDGLAVALHCVYHTTSFDGALVKCVNFNGDADSTGSMVGQVGICKMFQNKICLQINRE